MRPARYAAQNESCARKISHAQNNCGMIGGGRVTIGNKCFHAIKFYPANSCGKGVWKFKIYFEKVRNFKILMIEF